MDDKAALGVQPTAEGMVASATANGRVASTPPSVAPPIPPGDVKRPEKLIREIELQDPLSEQSHTQRKYLLVICTTALVMVKAELVPARITPLGIEFSGTDQKALLGVAAFIIGYFLISFIIYAACDYVIWRGLLREARVKWRDYSEKMQEIEKTQAEGRHWQDAYHADPSVLDRIPRKRIQFARASLDFGFVVIFALYAISVTIGAARQPRPDTPAAPLPLTAPTHGTNSPPASVGPTPALLSLPQQTYQTGKR